MHLKGNMFVSNLMKMEHSIKFAIIYLCGHVCIVRGSVRGGTRLVGYK